MPVAFFFCSSSLQACLSQAGPEAFYDTPVPELQKT